MTEATNALIRKVKRQSTRDMLLEDRRAKARLDILSDPTFYFHNKRYEDPDLSVINEIRDATAGILHVE